MTAGERELRYRCHRCGIVLSLVGRRLTTEALGALRDHVRALHPDAALPADASAGDVLRQFDVEAD